MKHLDELFDNNREWAESIKAEDPTFFKRLSKQHNPEYLWIGCSDARVPANEIVGLLPGELFVHRNIANCILHTDFNCLSVIYYAVRVLQVKHIIVSGHYGCGGIQAAMSQNKFGLTDHWIRGIRDLRYTHTHELDQIHNQKKKIDRMCELNVIQQVANVSHIPVVQEAWNQGRELTIHGWIYGVCDGMIRKLVDPIYNINQVAAQYRLENQEP